MSRDEVARCAVCGKTVRGQVFGITKGRFEKGRWTELSIWGYAHEKCFSRAVTSSVLTMEELRNDSGSTGASSR